ncbi:unnamed protein product [Gongylonema pulchrum]|uniref:ADP,ATP carrier protein n=1 Tax=Gongylonema pulchrum TaxID=637853 RepID=A0A183EEP9_9BILA|nr:unnamed protein product [Gongylonema pulchrum]
MLIFIHFRYQKTTEVVAGTADTVKKGWNDMRNSSLFKSFESKLGTAYTQAKMAASTSIDQLSGIAKSSSGTSSQADPVSPASEKAQMQ